MIIVPSLPELFWDFPIEGVPGESALVVSRPDIQALFILNQAASFIWKSLRNGNSYESLAERFAERFGLSLSRAATDIESTLDSWSQNLLSPPRATASVAPPHRPPASGLAFICDYTIGETHVRLVADDAEFVEEIVPRLAHLRAGPHSSGATFHVFRQDGQLWVFCGDSCIGAEPEVTVARTILLEEMARLSRPGTDWLTILHAGACGTEAGCVIMPAATHSGKSTLAAALMHSGLHLFSDDCAAIDRHTLQVVTLPFALMLREGSWPVLEPYFPELTSYPILDRNGYTVRFLPPPQPGRQARSAPPRCLLFVQFQPGAQAQLQPVTKFESLLGLQKSGFWVPHNRESIAQFLSWVQSLPAYTLTYSDLSEAIPLVQSLLA